jgi:4-hydroxy-2-oxoheptanedioate aldolase
MGLMGQVTHSDVVGAIQQVTDACQQAGIKLGVFGVSATAVAPYIAQGYTLITVGMDALLLGQAAQELLTAVRQNDL